MTKEEKEKLAIKIFSIQELNGNEASLIAQLINESNGISLPFQNIFVDHNANSVTGSIGLTEGEAKEILHKAFNVMQDSKSISKGIEKILNTFQPKEIAYLFTQGLISIHTSLKKINKTEDINFDELKQKLSEFLKKQGIKGDIIFGSMDELNSSNDDSESSDESFNNDDFFNL